METTDCDVGLFVNPQKAMENMVVTRQLATTCVLKQYSRGEEIKSTNMAHTRITATKRWRRTRLIKIIVASSGSRRRLLDLSCFLG